jgi:hypothetical protein
VAGDLADAAGPAALRWADAIHANADKIGRIETSQNGKLLNR